MALGLADDVCSLPWKMRLAIQSGVAASCVLAIPDLRLSLFIPFPLPMAAISILWIVSLVNAFNMLDNMDGLCGGVAAIIAGLLVAILLVSPDPTTGEPQRFVVGLLLVSLGSLLGFLWHNRHPAKIFLGDAGSYLIGFLLATATLLATYASEQGNHRHAVW